MKKENLPAYKTITVEQLIRSIREGHKNRERFCFVLGAGASVESGIPNGQSMGFEWMKEIMDPLEISVYKSQAKNLYDGGKIKHNFEEIEEAYNTAYSKGKTTLPSEFYFDVYMIRFFPNLRNGYFDLEKSMDKKTPSMGYHPLVKLLADEKNGSNLVVTTNFDTLIEDALSLYTDAKPLVINHEQLATFAGDPNITRPIIAKIHRGIFFSPLSQSDDMNGLKGDWDKVLSQIFNCYTPIVIGYGGGDHSLMDFLKRDEVSLRNGIYWCYYGPSENPDNMSDDIKNIVEKKDGYFVETQGFNATLWSIGEAFSYPIDPDQVMEFWNERQNERIENYKSQRNKIKPDISITPSDESNNTEIDSKVSEKIEVSENPPETAWEFSRQGDDFRRKGDYKSAIDSYTNAINQDNSVMVFYYWRGISYLRLNRYKKAIEDFSKAIKLEPEDVNAYISRGYAYGNLEKHKDAIADYTKAISIDSNNSVIYNNRGYSYSKLEIYDKALENLNKAISINENNIIAITNRAYVYAKTEKYHEANEDIDKVFSMNPNSANAYNIRGMIFFNLKEYDKALENHNKAISINPNYASAYENRAKLYHAIEKTDLAKADEEKAEQIKKERNVED